MRSKPFAVFFTLFVFSIFGNYRTFAFSLAPVDERAPFVSLGILLFGACLLSGGSRAALLLVAATGIATSLLQRSLSNHATLYLSLYATILAGWGVSVLQERRLRVDVRRLHGVLAALIRIEFLVFYFWVALHKLNPQFFAAETSCAVVLLERSTAQLPGLALPPGFEAWIGPLTFAAEASIPLLLLSARTRRVGVLLGFGFHTLLASGFPAFQFLVLGCLALFVPEADLEASALRARRWFGWGRPVVRAFGASSGARALAGMGIAIGVVEFYAWSVQPANAWLLGQRSFPLVSVLACAALTMLYAALVMRGRGWSVAWSLTLFPRIAPVLWCLPIVVVFQGAQPHLGFNPDYS